MKRTFVLMLALALLVGCGNNYTQEATVQAVQSPTGDDAPKRDVLPELTPLGALSAPAVVTEGREPSKDYDLPGEVTEMVEWDGRNPIARLAELLDQGAAFYGVNDTRGGCVLLQWGGSLTEFDWLFATPRRIPPRLFCFDTDGDREDELAVICCAGSGTEVSIEELHIIKKDPDGTLTDYAFPESLWGEQVPTLFDTAVMDGRTFAVLGRELVEFDGEGLDLETASAGTIAGFGSDGTSLFFEGAFCLSPEGSAVPCYVAETSADVFYKDGVFTLENFHLYSYDQ